MKSISTKDLTADMVVAADVITTHGQLIVPRGSVLNDALIAKIGFYGINKIEIEELTPEMLSPTPEEDIRDASHYSTRIRKSPEFKSFQASYEKNLKILEKTYDAILREDYDSVDLDYLLDECTALFQSNTTLDLFNKIHALDLDSTLYTSNLNVGLISRGMGRWLKYPKETLDILTLSGLLHDIGKLKVSPSILSKRGKLTDEEFAEIKKHAQYGRKLLKNVPGIDPRIVNAAVQHHERYDGSGYPMELEGAEIDPIAATVAIADVFEGMTAVRAHKNSQSLFSVIETFEDNGLQKYDPKIILTFLERLANAYQNRTVILSDDRRCRIIYINKGKLSHPIVEFEDETTLDLSKNLHLHIKSVI